MPEPSDVRPDVSAAGDVATIEILGGGRMGTALLTGLLAGGSAPDRLVVVEQDADRRAQLVGEFPGVRVVASPTPAHDVLVCTKPGDVTAALRTAADAGLRRVLSVAAGVGTRTIEAVVGPIPVVRAMPNTPALLGAGATAIAAGRHASVRDLDDAEIVLAPTGLVVRVDEAQLDAVTAVSGSGPAYVFLLAEHLRSSGRSIGLSADQADALVRQTVLGAARMLVETGEDPAALRSGVTSPGGTTAAAVAAFEDGGLAALVDRAVRAAAQRSAELGAAAAVAVDGDGAGDGEG